MAKLFIGSSNKECEYFMGYIHCCGGLRKTKTFVISPYKGYKMCELDVLAECPVCEHYVVQLTRLDDYNNISVVRYINKKAKKFFEKIKSKILYEKRYYDYSKRTYGNFYLNYNEYGIKKRCYSNLSMMRIGLYSNFN